MLKKFLIVWAAVLLGIFSGYFSANQKNIIPQIKESSTGQVIGFLPFWLIDKAGSNYSNYLTELSYFNLTIDSDGTIQKLTAPGESDPGWHALSTGKVDSYLASAKDSGLKLSLTIFSGNDDKISQFLEDPETSSTNLISEISPIMNKYGFSDLNLDIEQVKDASPEARMKYSDFVAGVRKKLNKNTSLTVDISPIAFVKNTNLADPKSLEPNIDRVILMAYDYHNPGSFVTGPIAPLMGAGTVSEFDVETAVKEALRIVPSSKLILGMPLYGYSWESINPSPRSATIPSSFVTLSSRSVTDFLGSCASCSAEFDKTDFEYHFSYKDQKTETYHQVFYPDITSLEGEVGLAKNNNLAGTALWALGYEDPTILSPLAGYRR